MLSTITNIKVENPLTGMDLVITWDISPDPVVIGYNIYRSLSSNPDEAEKLNDMLILTNQYRDTTAIQRINSSWFYTVTAVDSLNNESPKAPMVTFRMQSQEPMFWKLNEMVRRHNIMLRLHGEDVYYWVRKTTGPRCSCYDESHGQQLDPFCTSCWGTGYQDGFIGLGWTRMIIDPPRVMLKLAPTGFIMDSRSTVWAATYPKMKNGDLIVRKSNQRYELDSFQEYPWGGQTTAQICSLNEIEPRNYQVFGLPTEVYV